MTAATVSRAAARNGLAAPPRRKSKVGFGDLFALTMRQNRLALSLITLFYVLYGLLVQLSNGAASLGDWRFDPKDFVMVPAALVAVFWGAPMLSAEYEQHTNVLVWSQDVPVVRWLLAKLVLLGGIVVVLSGLLTLVVRNQLAGEWNGLLWSGSPMSPWGPIGFEAWIPLGIAYALFGLVFGVAVGALCRRTVTALGITLVGFAAIRVLIATELRPWLTNSLVTPLQRSWSFAVYLTQSPTAVAGGKDLDINSQVWLNAAGLPTRMPDACWSGSSSNSALLNCASSHGVTRVADIYQPYSRLVIFHSIELAVYVVLIALCVGFAVWSVRRRASI
jgi:hypothetical protein